MCGLFGFVDLQSDRISPDLAQVGRRALETLAHRGPDRAGERVSGNVYMGHCRLDVLDLSDAGRQPFASLDGDLVAAIDGRVFNFRDLKGDLGESLFASKSDTEILLHGVRAYGVDRLLDKMDGMYAGAILERRQNRLTLFRDRAGQKPLIYANLGRYVVWTSEIKAILCFCADLGIVPALDETALFDVLTYGYVPGAKTMYRQIRTLEPAHALTLDCTQGRMDLRRYWVLPAVGDVGSVDPRQIGETLSDLIRKSVREQLVSDVLVGVSLKAGVPSGVLATCAADLVEYNVPETFSVASPQERHLTGKIAGRLETAHQASAPEFQAGPEDLVESLLLWHDQPLADARAAQDFSLFEYARRDVTVFLTEDGGNELFGGYRRYRTVPSLRAFQAPFRVLSQTGPRLSLSRKRGGISGGLAGGIDLCSYFDPLEVHVLAAGGADAQTRSLWRKELGIPKDYDDLWHLRRYERRDLSSRKRAQYMDFHTFLPDNLLTRTDRTGMAVSLETRRPFLAKPVIEYVFSLPESFLYRGRRLCGGLAYAFRETLPAESLEQVRGEGSGPEIENLHESLLRRIVPDSSEKEEKTGQEQRA